MLRLLPALLRQPQQGHGVMQIESIQLAPQLLIQPVAEAEEDLTLLSVGMCRTSSTD